MLVGDQMVLVMAVELEARLASLTVIEPDRDVDADNGMDAMVCMGTSTHAIPGCWMFIPLFWF